MVSHLSSVTPSTLSALLLLLLLPPSMKLFRMVRRPIVLPLRRKTHRHVHPGTRSLHPAGMGADSSCPREKSLPLFCCTLNL